MPEYPDIVNYAEAIEEKTLGTRLEEIELLHPFLLRSVAPMPESASGRAVRGVSRVGKRIVIELDGPIYLVIHLMIAGRLHWQPGGTASRETHHREGEPARKPGPETHHSRTGASRSGQSRSGTARTRSGKSNVMGRFRFAAGTMSLTEAGSKRRASLHVAGSADELLRFDRGGLDPLVSDPRAFRERLTSENHTLKRALTDPRLVSGIGNAYSDEILFDAQLSPFDLTTRLDEQRYDRLLEACRSTLLGWAGTIRAQRAGEFPEKVTAFRDGMAVHGRFGSPCPVCGTEVQRIRYAENECNYCPRCQTGGRVFADRALSRLLKNDWPSRIEELEELKGR